MQKQFLLNTCKVLPIRIFFGIVTTETQIKVFTNITVDSAAHNEALTMVTSILHVHHLMIVLMPLWLCTTCLKEQ